MKIVIFYKAGETIIKEGTQGIGFYILKEGSVEVSKEGLNVATINEPNTIFGEMSDILKGPRTCTIKARTDSSIIHVPRDIDGIIDEYPSVAKKLIIMLAERLRNTTKEMLLFDLPPTMPIWSRKSRKPYRRSFGKPDQCRRVTLTKQHAAASLPSAIHRRIYRRP